VSSNSPYEVIRFMSVEDGTHAVIVFRMPYDSAVSLKEYAEGARTSLVSLGFENFAIGKTTIGLRPAVTLDFDKSDMRQFAGVGLHGGTWSCREYFITDGTMVYVLGFGTSNKDARFELFERMAKSFEILTDQ